jgi:hypothetical protein
MRNRATTLFPLNCEAFSNLLGEEQLRGQIAPAFNHHRHNL